MVIYMKHPTHGTKVAISEDEAKADEKNGWSRFVVESPVVEAGPVVGADEGGTESGEPVTELEFLRAQYKARFDKAPHHKKSAETLKAELAA